jgi:hypothetical protein
LSKSGSGAKSKRPAAPVANKAAQRGQETLSPMRRALRLLAVFAALIAAFVVLMTVVYLLPEGPILRNLEPSLALLRAEGLYPQPFIGDPGFVRDNYTDAIMLDTTVRNPGQNAFQAAMAGPKNGAPQSGSTIDALAETLAGTRNQPMDYAYYWNGYQVFLRPAMSLMSYPAVRFYNLLLLAALGLWAALLLWKTAGTEATVAFVFSFVLTGFIVVPASLQFSSMTYLSLAGVVAVLVALRSRRFASLDLEIFLVLGMLAAFLDLLTMPLLTLLMPLVAVLIVRTRAAKFSMRDHIVFVVKTSAMWALGYLASWLTKTMLSSLILGRNVFAEAAKQFMFRIGLQTGQSKVVQALSANIHNLFPNLSDQSPGLVSFGPAGVLLLLAFAAFLAVALTYHRKTSEISQASAVLLVVPIPYLWYIVANNHSGIHSFFTYRIQAGAVFALLYFLMVLPDYDRIRNELPGLSASSSGPAKG